jgi:ATP-binding cassette subfamily C (CFTR/MRP) protein 1
MDASRESGPLSDKFLAVYKARMNEATAYNSRLNDHTITPSAWNRFKWNAYSTCSSALPSDFANFAEGGRHTRKQRYMAYENEWRQRSGRKQASIIWALNDVLTGFWGAGIFKVLGDTSQMMTPLVTKQLIRHANNGKSTGSVHRQRSC